MAQGSPAALVRIFISSNSEFCDTDKHTLATYPAKDFFINSKWEPRKFVPQSKRLPDQVLNASARSRPSLTALDLPQPVPHSFKVPEALDSTSSEASREGSVQIMESHPRTFSVPSSDEDSNSDSDDGSSIELASSTHDDGQKVSAATTPEHPVAQKQATHNDTGFKGESTPSKTRAINVRGPDVPASHKTANAGSSQQEPIDLEPLSFVSKVVDSESEDDGPEILSTRHSPPPRKPYRFAHVNLDDVEFEDPGPVMSTVRETQVPFSLEKQKSIERQLSPELRLGSVNESSDSFDSADDDDDDSDRGDGFSDEEDEEEMENLSTKSLPPSSVSGPEIRDELLAAELPMQQTVNPGHVNTSMSMSESVDVSRPAFVEYRPPPRRAPSPSDAALAKKFSSSVPKSRVQQIMEIHREPDIDGSRTAFRKSMLDTTFGVRPFGPSYFESYPLASLDDANTYPKPYEEGPFSNRGFNSGPSINSGFFPNDDYNGYQTFPFTEYNPPDESRLPDHMNQQLPEYVSYPDIEEDARLAAKLQAEEDMLASASSVPTAPVIPTSSKPRKSCEGQSSKINIASLVNDPNVESSNSRKRKADDMSTLTKEETLLAPKAIKPNDKESIRVVASYTYDDQGNEHGTVLPDAQVTDVPLVNETTPLTQDHVQASANESVPKQNATEIKEPEEPARKKVRTSKPPPTFSKGIGKFVSGVCVGLVGAFAAFVATIPANVREEALREMSNAM